MKSCRGNKKSNHVVVNVDVVVWLQSLSVPIETTNNDCYIQNITQNSVTMNDFFDVFEYLQTSKHLKKPIYHNKQSLELFCSIVCREFSVFFTLSLCYYLGREVIFCISCYSSGVGWHTTSRVRFIMPSKKYMMKQWLSRSSFK